MDFRYRLAKKTFKNKKIPPKGVPGTDCNNQKQQGDDYSTEGNPIKHDKQTIKTKTQHPERRKQFSHTPLFSFRHFHKFALEIKGKSIQSNENGE